MTDLVKFLYCSDRKLRYSCRFACETCEYKQERYTDANLPAVCFALGKLLEESEENER